MLKKKKQKKIVKQIKYNNFYKIKIGNTKTVYVWVCLCDMIVCNIIIYVQYVLIIYKIVYIVHKTWLCNTSLNKMHKISSFYAWFVWEIAQ